MMKKLLCSLLFTVLAVGFMNAQTIDVNGQGNVNVIANGDITPDVADDTQFPDVDIAGGSEVQIFVITNTGTDLLDIGLNNLSNDIDFMQSTPPNPVQIAAGETSTFSITFDPVDAVIPGKISDVTITIFNNETFEEIEYTFRVGGTAIEVIPPPEPILRVFGGASLDEEIFDTDVASIAQGSDFGDVETGDNLVRTFRVMNDVLATANLVIDNFGSPGSSDFGASLEPFGADITILPGDFIDFTVTYIPNAIGPDSGSIIISHNDLTPATLDNFSFGIIGNGIAPIPLEPEIDIFDNASAALASGGTVNYGDVDVTSGNSSFTFTIENNGTADLTLDAISPFIVIGGANPSDFTLTGVPVTPITPTGSTTFAITFNPSALSTRTATVTIDNNDADEGTYTIFLTGEGIDANAATQLLITQYYQGLDDTGNNDGSDNWIEVKNVSTTLSLPGAYYLALFIDTAGTVNGGIASNTPDEWVQIPALSPGEVVLFNRSGASLPTAGNLGAVSITATEVCRFDGDDIIVISTTNDTNTYNFSIDVLGTIGTSAEIDWGSDTSLIKGCGTTESPSTTYDPNDYTVLTLDEVNTAGTTTNITLGIQTVGPTIFTSSWDNGIPDKTKQAIINGAYVGGTSFEACDLTINSGSSINLNSGNAYILVDGNLTINGTFNIGDTESLIMTDPDAIISGQIAKTEVSEPLNNSSDYTYWSSPVNTTAAAAFPGVSNIYRWDTAQFLWFLESGTMNEGQGYIAQAPDGSTQHTVTFTGTPHNGLVNFGMVFNDDGIDNDYNLMGNPYPSAIDIDQFIEDSNNIEIFNNSIDGTIYLWTHNTAAADNGTDPDYVRSDYATYNLLGGTASANGGAAPTNNIGSGQGFFVRSVSNGTVFFENKMRLDDNGDPLSNTQFFKSSTNNVVEKDRLWLDMTSEEGAFHQILVGFMDKATDAEDRGYDGRKIGGAINFYSRIEESKFAIQALGAFNPSKEITLGVDTNVSRVFKISISNIEGVLKDEDVYLLDNTLNVLHDLKLGAYEFEALPGEYTNRFTLKFNSGVLNTDDFELNNSFIVYSENSTLKVKASDEISTLKIYDITGRLLVESEPNSIAFDLPVQNIKAGTVLILNATMKNGSTISKKAIKY